MKLFELFATLSLDTEQFNNDSEKALQRADELGTKIGHAIASVLNGAESAGKWLADNAETLWDWGKTAVEAAAEIRAEESQFKAAFADLADDATAAFARVSKDTGTLAYMLRGVGKDAFQMFTGAGVESGEALSRMELYLRLAADAAAGYDTTLANSHDHLLSFLKGNSEAGEAIGLNIGAQERSAKALELYGKSWDKLTEAERQWALLNIAKDVYERNNIWGRAKEEAGEYTAMVERLQVQWNRTLAQLGEPLLKHVLPVMSKISEWFEDNPELVSKLAEGIGNVADKLGSMLLDLFEFIAGHSDDIIAFLDGVSGFVTLIFETLSGSRNASNVIKENAPGIVLTQEEIDKWNAFVDLYDRYNVARSKHEGGEMSSEDFGKIQAEYEEAYNSFTDREWMLINKYQDSMKKDHPRSFGYYKIDPDLYAGGYYAETGADGATVPVDAELEPGATNGIQRELNSEKYEVPVFVRLEGENYGQYLLRNIGYAFGIGLNGHATGLDYVPYNDYAARLHEGEAVLTKAEAEAWRRHGLGGGGAPAIDYNLMAEAMLTAFSGVSLQMDKRVVGGLVGPTVSRDIARGARNRRYTG